MLAAARKTASGTSPETCYRILLGNRKHFEQDEQKVKPSA